MIKKTPNLPILLLLDRKIEENSPRKVPDKYFMQARSQKCVSLSQYVSGSPVESGLCFYKRTDVYVYKMDSFITFYDLHQSPLSCDFRFINQQIIYGLHCSCP